CSDGLFIAVSCARGGRIISQCRYRIDIVKCRLATLGGGARRGARLQEVAKNEGKDPAVLVVVDLDRRGDPEQQPDLLRRAVLAADDRGELLARLHALLDAEDVDRLVALDA